MKRGNTTLEYLCLIAFSAAAIIAMVVYIGRGFQGNLRNSADQIGAAQYDPGNTVIFNSERKLTKDTIVSISKSKTTYGSADGSTPGATDSSSVSQGLTNESIIRDTNEQLGAFQNDTWR
ncbi:MAG: hypothetical protein WAQ07_00110 [Candidatus Omnitrophota bacterium]